MNHVTTALEPGQVDVSSQKRTYTVLEIQDILSISRPTAYALIRKNYFRSIRVGGQIRVSKKSFDEWLDRGNGGDAHEYSARLLPLRRSSCCGKLQRGYSCHPRPFLCHLSVSALCSDEQFQGKPAGISRFHSTFELLFC